MTLGTGLDLARHRYPGWGYSSHCDGREGGELTFPFWLVSALQWLADTRDPFSSGHGYPWGVGAAESAADLDRIRAIGQRVYQSPDAVDPCSGYNGKAHPGHFQTLRSVIKDCVPADAHFPLIYRKNSPDYYWRLHDIEGIGEIEGPAIEYHLFTAGTGVAWSEQEFVRAAERVCTLERALQVRHWARDRSVDEMVLPYFERTELYQSLYQSPFLERRHGLDREQFKPVVDGFYALHGWDAERGWPNQQTLRELDLEDVYEPMVDGAARAREVAPDYAAGEPGQVRFYGK
jgi:hypothetical protein